jgi:ferredoxin-NADP reductase
MNTNFLGYHLDYNDDDIVCHCLSIKRNEIDPILNNSRNDMDLDGLIGCSGVGSVCTGCHPLLQEMMGETIWTPVKVESITQLSNDAKAFRFKSQGEAFHAAKSGQHIILQAYINGTWELRRYTLTTVAGETDYREIIVQKERKGKVSNWLHNITEAEVGIRISQPAGDVTPDIVNSKPLICLVGGVGITPAISFIRSINKELKNPRLLFIDHSVLNHERLILSEELKKVSAESTNINTHLRITDSTNFISEGDIQTLIHKHPQAEFFVCGPARYTETVLGYLDKLGIKEQLIHIEYFSAPETKILNQSKSYFYFGLILFAAFLIQELFQLKSSWLENLQAQEAYKIYSGLGMLLYILSQFILPYNKSCETAHATATTYQQHKFRGALAPFVFFMHSTSFGVAYILMLSIAYFGNYLLGLFNHERIKNPIKRIRYFKVWLPAHIAMSIITLALIGLHIYVVVSY